MAGHVPTGKSNSNSGALLMAMVCFTVCAVMAAFVATRTPFMGIGAALMWLAGCSFLWRLPYSHIWGVILSLLVNVFGPP